MVNPNNYVLEVMGVHFNFPVAVWVALPAAVLLLFTVLHMAYHGMRGYMKKQKFQRDAASLEDALYWALLNEPKEQKYLLDEIKRSAVLLNKANLTMIDGVEGLSDRLTKVLNILNKIKNGEYVDLKENKLHKVFNEGNPYLIQNRLNRLKNDPTFVEEVMRSSVKYSEMVRKQALEIFARTTNFEHARKYAKQFDVANFFVLLERLDKEEDMGLTPDILEVFATELKLKCSDFVRMARIVKRHLRPEENLALFRKLQKENPKAQNAYLYLLFEYELLEEVERYLDEQDENDFIKFRALLELKKQNQRFKLEDLIDAESICRNI
jgi:hypothetical protein